MRSTGNIDRAASSFFTDLVPKKRFLCESTLTGTKLLSVNKRQWESSRRCSKNLAPLASVMR